MKTDRKTNEPNLYDTSARVGVQLVFAPCRRYGILIAVWWYIIVRRWVELLVSQGLIQEAETTVKLQLGAKAKKVTRK